MINSWFFEYPKTAELDLTILNCKTVNDMGHLATGISVCERVELKLHINNSRVFCIFGERTGNTWVHVWKKTKAEPYFFISYYRKHALEYGFNVPRKLIVKKPRPTTITISSLKLLLTKPELEIMVSSSSSEWVASYPILNLQRVWFLSQSSMSQSKLLSLEEILRVSGSRR